MLLAVLVNPVETPCRLTRPVEGAMRRFARWCGVFLMAVILGDLAGASPAWAAEDFPGKPVTLVIPVGAGGSHDLTARALASVAHQYLGQPLIIELKPGGSSTLPAVEGRSHGPDPLMAVAKINHSPVALMVNPTKPWKSLKEMVEWAQANPSKLVHATTGPWGAADLPMKQMMKEYHFTAQLVPYDGGGPALLAILGGHADSSINPLAQTLPHIRAGKLRGLAILEIGRA